MKSLIRFIPNALTLSNAGLGLLAMYAISRGELTAAALFVAVAMIIDFLDGFVARLLNAQSPIGAQLDSLADMVTFGAVPGFLLAHLSFATSGLHFTPEYEWVASDWLTALPAAVYVMCAAWRLGFFNTDITARPHFLGVPTPATAMVVMSLPLIIDWQYHLNVYHPIGDDVLWAVAEAHRWDATDLVIAKSLLAPRSYMLLSLILGALMVLKFPVINVKFKGLSWRENKWRYGLFIWALVAYLIFLIPYLGWNWLDMGLIDYLIIPIFMTGYFVLSLIYAIFGLRKKDE